MTIDFEVTPDDIIAYNLYCLNHLETFRQKKRRARAIWGSIAILALVVMIAAQSNPIVVTAFLCILCVAGIILINHIFFLDYNVRQIVRKQIAKGRYTQALGQQSLSIAPDIYIHRSPFAEVKRTWQISKGVQVTDSHAYIFVDTTCAEIIPRRAFGDQETWQRFIDQIQQYYTHAIRSPK